MSAVERVERTLALPILTPSSDIAVVRKVVLPVPAEATRKSILSGCRISESEVPRAVPEWSLNAC